VIPKDLKTSKSISFSRGFKPIRMQPNVVFLGTGQGSAVVGKQLRASGGIVIQTNEHQLHIDPGPGSLIMARDYYINPRETTAVLVSHYHLRHCNDVNIVIDAMTHSGLDKRGVLIANDLLINGNKTIRPYLTDFHKNCLEKYMVLKAGQRSAIDDIEIHATTTMHSTDAIGFKLLTPEFSLSYLSDTAYCPELIDDHKGSEIIILNVVSPFDIKRKYNLNSESAVKIINKLRPRLAIITHFSIKMLEADPMLEARKINRLTKSQVMAAKDGMAINPVNYSKRRKQKRLTSF